MGCLPTVLTLMIEITGIVTTQGDNMWSSSVLSLRSTIVFTSMTCRAYKDSLLLLTNLLSSHGLRLNPNKATCTTLRTNHQTSPLTWNSLNETKQVTYLGTVLSNDISQHTDPRDKVRM